MTKKTTSGSGRTLLSLFYRSPRLMLGLSLLSGFSIFSSSLVIAQTDSVGDTGSAPRSTAVKAASAPAPEPPAERKQVVTTIVVPVTSEPRANREYVAPAPPPAPIAAKKPVPSRTSETALRKPATLRRTTETVYKKPSASRRKPETALRKPATLRRTSEAAVRKPATLRRTSEAAVRKPATLRRAPETAFKKPSTLPGASETAQKKPSPLERPSETAYKKPVALQRTASALGPAITVGKKPTLAAPDLSIPETEIVATPRQLQINPPQNQENPQVPDAPTNRDLEPTDYSIGATGKDEEPAPVIVTERSTGCRTVMQNGQLLNAICDGVQPSSQLTRRPRPTGDIAKKQTANREIAIRQAVGQQRDNSGRIVRETPLSKVTIHEPRLAKVILHDPQLAQATTQEPQLTGVRRLPRVSVAATQPVKMGPVKLRLRGTQRAASRRYTAYSTQPQRVAPLPASSFPVSEGSVSEGWTSPTGLDYYNVTRRPEGRPNTSNANFMFPLAIPSAISSLFGWRIHPVTGDYRFHTGTDIGAPEGTPVLAAVSGQVITADFMGGYGLTVVVQHEDGNNISLYGHLSEIFVQPGEQVEQGNVIGRVGTTGLSTGPHLHFEWRHMTPDGWVALDATPNIEYAMAQFVKSLEVAQVPAQPESVSPSTTAISSQRTTDERVAAQPESVSPSTPQAVSQATEQLIPPLIPQQAPQQTSQPISLRGL